MTSKSLTFYDREDRPWPSQRLTSSAIVGHTTTRTSRIWLRAWAPGSYCLIVSLKEIDTSGQPSLRRKQKQPVGATITAVDGTRARVEGRVFVASDVSHATDLTAVFDVDALEPGTRYHYAVFFTGRRQERWEAGRDEPLSFLTEEARPERVVFGLFSCHMPFNGRNVLKMHMWESFREMLELHGANFVIGGGDQVYADGDKKIDIWRWLRKVKSDVSKLPMTEQVAVMVSWYRDIYRGYWGDLEMRRVFRRWPQYMIWDDHEIMDGWGSYTEKELSDTLDSMWEWENVGKNVALARNMFAAAKQAYGEYQHSHNPPTDREQWDYTFTWGRCAFFVLDMRGHRDYGRPTDDKILGAAQFRRLEAWLKGAEATEASVVFIVSPVPTVHLKDFVMNYLDLTLLGLADDLRDEWEHPSNRAEFFRLLNAVFDFSQRHGKKVVFLSGDVHISAAFRLTSQATPAARVYQLTSSGITYCKSPGRALKLAAKKHGVICKRDNNHNAPDIHFERLDLFADNNFGLVSVDETHATVAWDLYGSSDDEKEIIRRKRIFLD